MNQELKSSIETAKRSCTRCYSHQNFRPNNDDKQLALNATKKATNLLRIAFDDLRAQDAPIEQINKVKSAKTLCLDATDACNACKKEKPKLREILLEM